MGLPSLDDVNPLDRGLDGGGPLDLGRCASAGLGDGVDDGLEASDVAVEIRKGLLELAHKITAQPIGISKSAKAASAWTMAGGSLGPGFAGG